MTSPGVSNKHTDWILETIDHLRKRKARPDVARICHVVRRRFGLSPAETEAKLEKLVDAEIVIKVDYKGNVSYRNAARWRKSMLGCGVLNSTAISTKILQAILEITKSSEAYNKSLEGRLNNNNVESANNNQDSETNEPTEHISRAEDSTKSNTDEAVSVVSNTSGKNSHAPEGARVTGSGIALEILNSWLKANCEGFTSLRSPLTVILKREVDAGRVVRLPGGDYAISAPQMAAISAAAGEIRPLKNAPSATTTTTKKDTASHSVAQANTATSNVAKYKSSSADSARVNKVVGSKSSLIGSTLQSQSILGVGQPQVGQPARRGRPPKQRPWGLNSGMEPTLASSLSSLANSSSGSAPLIAATAAPSFVSGSKLKRILTTDEGAANGADKKYAKRNIGHIGELLCDFCERSSLANPRGEPEVLLKCKDCSAKAHPSCMKYSRLLASRACRAPWQCMDCKTCFMCWDSGHADQMLFCDGCDRGFHMSCHQPPLSKKPSGIWECSDCRLENMALQRSSIDMRHTLTHYSSPLTPAESPVPGNNSQTEEPLSTSPTYEGDGKYPDASGWSVDDVVNFFTSAGFGVHAQLFREQEIDGVSLLLLKRSDVLKGLDMKLGPALKVNRLVQGLQTAKQGRI